MIPTKTRLEAAALNAEVAGLEPATAKQIAFIGRLVRQLGDRLERVVLPKEGGLPVLTKSSASELIGRLVEAADEGAPVRQPRQSNTQRRRKSALERQLGHTVRYSLSRLIFRALFGGR